MPMCVRKRVRDRGSVPSMSQSVAAGVGSAYAAGLAPTTPVRPLGLRNTPDSRLSSNQPGDQTGPVLCPFSNSLPGGRGVP